MDATQLFGTIIRILNQPVFPPRAKPALAKAHHVVRPTRLPESRMPAQAAIAVAAVRPPVVSAPAPLATPVTTQAMRTLEEVRADLARLREHARRRHVANAQARRDISFAPTDFMDFAAKPAARPATPASGFAPTDFLEMRVIKPS
ncbi:MAG TPA: hypothetical protein VLJ19_12185 [Variovorax sp.]|nr:hypothetical protein [Variovorax sp.]